MTTIQFLRGKIAVIKSLARHWDNTYHGNQIGLFLDDVQDHVLTKTSKLLHFEDILSRSHSGYLARLSVDNVGNRTRTLKVVIRITVIAAIGIPLTVTCGLFGMNVVWDSERAYFVCDGEFGRGEENGVDLSARELGVRRLA
jgi:magnesium transporter